MISPKPGDPRVKRTLEELGYKYSINSTGEFELIFGLEGDRKQTVVISSETNEFMNLEVREISSIAVLANEEDLTREFLMDLLEDNSTTTFGNWSIIKGEGKVVVSFITKVSAEIDPSTLIPILELVCNKADYLESMFYEEDSF